jgi:hypothetical protein
MDEDHMELAHEWCAKKRGGDGKTCMLKEFQRYISHHLGSYAGDNMRGWFDITKIPKVDDYLPKCQVIG